MKGLILRDMLNIRQSMKSILLSTVFIIVVFAMTDMGMSGALCIPLLLCMGPLNSFQRDAALKWNRVNAILPIQHKDIVKARYITYVFVLALSLLIAFLYAYAYMELTAFSQTNDHFTLSLCMTLAFAFPLLFASILFPVAYYFKGERMESVLVICVAIVFGIVAAGAELIKLTSINFQYSDLNSYIVYLGIASILVFIVSYFVSVKTSTMEKKQK